MAKTTKTAKTAKGIPSNFGEILDVLRDVLSPTLALQTADLLMLKIAPKGRVLCACNRMWLPNPKGAPKDVPGHGYDDCPMRRG